MVFGSSPNLLGCFLVGSVGWMIFESSPNLLGCFLVGSVFWFSICEFVNGKSIWYPVWLANDVLLFPGGFMYSVVPNSRSVAVLFTLLRCALCITVGDVVVEEYVDVLLLVIVPSFRSIASINRSFSVNVCLGEPLVLRVAWLGFMSVVVFPQLLSVVIGISSIAAKGCPGILVLDIPMLSVSWSFVSWCVLY